MRLGIRLPDGRLVTDPEWRCVADVMRGASAHGPRVEGDLVELPEEPAPGPGPEPDPTRGALRVDICNDVTQNQAMQLKVAASVKVTARRGSTPTATCGHSIDDMPPVTRQSRRPNGAESRNLNVRVPPDVLEAAKAAAAEREETLSAAVVRFLREYAALDTEEER